MTERQGGSDVGTGTETLAVPQQVHSTRYKYIYKEIDTLGTR